MEYHLHTHDLIAARVDRAGMAGARLATDALRRDRQSYDIKGRHGLGLPAEFPWAEECFRWLQQTF